jgi:hypothetical protein
MRPTSTAGVEGAEAGEAAEAAFARAFISAIASLSCTLSASRSALSLSFFSLFFAIAISACPFHAAACVRKSVHFACACWRSASFRAIELGEPPSSEGVGPRTGEEGAVRANDIGVLAAEEGAWLSFDRSSCSCSLSSRVDC